MRRYKELNTPWYYLSNSLSVFNEWASGDPLRRRTDPFLLFYLGDNNYCSRKDSISIRELSKDFSLLSESTVSQRSSALSGMGFIEKFVLQDNKVNRMINLSADGIDEYKMLDKKLRSL